MTSTQKQRPNYSRRFMIFAAAIVLVILAYTAVWYYAAGRIEHHANAAIAALNQGSDRRAACEDLNARGYPFRIGLFCHSIVYVEQSEGVSLRAGQFRSVAQIYNPFHAIVELDGPATIEWPDLPQLNVDWQTMRASLRLAQPLPERVSLEATGIEIASSVLVPDSNLAIMESGQIHMRPLDGDLDIAIRIGAMILSPALVRDAQLPPIDGLADIRLIGGALPGQDPRGGVRGRSFELHQVSISTPDEAGAVISGPLSIDGQGRIDADLQVSLRQPARIAERLAAIFPERGDEIRMSFQALSAMGEEPALPLRIDRGQMRLGLIPLGQLPPV